MVRRLVPLALLLTLSACASPGATPAPSSGVNRYVSVVYAELDRYTPTYFSSRDGWRAVTGRYHGALSNGASGDHTLTVSTAGATYGVLGVCDQDCSDVDLTVYDRAGTVVARDLLTDDYPVVKWSAAYSGEYRLRVSMAACRVNPCYYGVQLFMQD
jgi:hypothetical protein